VNTNDVVNNFLLLSHSIYLWNVFHGFLFRVVCKKYGKNIAGERRSFSEAHS